MRTDRATVRNGAGATLGALLLGLALAAPAAAGTPIGQVKTVSGEAFVVRDGARSPAKLGDMVFEKDTVETGPDGAIGITFSDNTMFSTGPNSAVSLAEYSFDSSNFRGAMLAEMRKGTLAVTSGDIPRASPGAMKIRTPTAILGVRGTTFAVAVSER